MIAARRIVGAFSLAVVTASAFASAAIAAPPPGLPATPPPGLSITPPPGSSATPVSGTSTPPSAQRPGANAEPTSSKREASQVVLVRYTAALAKVREPRIVVFDYAVEQLGLRNLVQTHRIYRSGARERDETRIVDGYTLNPPTIRTLEVGRNRYAVANIAPRPATSRFVFAGLAARAGRPQYVFRVRQNAAKNFEVDEVEIDGRSFLPTLVRFNVRTGKARGRGEIAFDRAGPHWLVQRAEATISLADGTPARERIVFSAYTFPKQLPPTTFETQHAPLRESAAQLLAPVAPTGKPLPTAFPMIVPAAPKAVTPPGR